MIIKERTSGFTLVEVLFTLAIISIAAAAIARNSMTNISLVNNNQQQINALNLAQSKLNEITAGPSDKIALQGQEAIEKVSFTWKSGITKETVTDQDNKFTTEMTLISVTVQWKENNNTKALTVKQNLCSQETQKEQP